MVDPEQNGFSAFTLRALVVGLLIVVTVSIAAPYSYFVLKSSKLASDYLPIGVVFPFVIVILFNSLLKRIHPSFSLCPSELILAFIMGLVATTICSLGFSSYLIGIIATPFYFASPENRWESYIHPYIPDWIVVDKANPAIRWFWEGLPEGEKIPWEVWAVPIFWWLIFAAVLYFVCLCIVVILRKQWVEKERLIFPLMEVPAEMVRESTPCSVLPAFMQSKLFWIGFVVPLLIALWNTIGYFSPLFPAIPLRKSISIARDFPDIRLYIFFPLIGFAYLINLGVSFSVWFFFLLGVIQIGIYNRIGFNIGKADVYCSAHPAMGWQGFGALIFMVLWGLWMARNHLKDVFKKAFTRSRQIDDSNELLSYRTAVLGLIFGLMFIAAWLMKSGMSPKVLALFLPATVILFIGVTRIVIEGGLVFLRGPLVGQTFTAFTLGSSAISASSMTSLAFTYVWAADIKSFFMAAAAHAVKLREMIGIDRKGVLRAMAVSVVVAAFTSIVYTIWVGYQQGASNLEVWPLGPGSRYPFENIVAKMSNPFGSDINRLKFLGIGAAVMAVLTYLRYRFLWWPIHPIGFSIASVLFIELSAFSIFLAWAAKLIILKVGGISLYRRMKPLFYGIIVGWFTGVGISFIVDMIWFPGQGHQIYGW